MRVDVEVVWVCRVQIVLVLVQHIRALTGVHIFVVNSILAVTDPHMHMGKL